MKNKNGFIAISLIYSFFLVLLMMLVAIMVDYTHNRVLLNKVKKATQEKLNNLSEFNPIAISKKADGTNFLVGDEIFYANNFWLVIKDDNENVTIMLKNAIPGSLLVEGLGDYASVVDINKNMMKYGATDLSCNWENSLAKIAVNYWLDNEFLLQKAIAKNTLLKMTFTDGIKDYNEYVRIQTKEEFSGKTGITCDDTQNKIWTLTKNINDNKVYKTNNCIDKSYTEFISPESGQAEIHPVITVKKI